MSTVDALVLWLRAAFARVLHLLKLFTGPEAALGVATTSCALVATGRAFILGASTWSPWALALATIIVATLAVTVMADAAIQRNDHTRTRAAMLKTNAAKPTGAPRVAEVPCKHGDMHRFVYGPDGWAPAGPGVDTRPEPEEAHAQ